MKAITCIGFILPVLVNGEMYELDYPEESFLSEGRWIFKAETSLPVPFEKCWDVITDYESIGYWFPETYNIEGEGEIGDQDLQLEVDFRDDVLGGFRMYQTYDIWETTGEDRRRFSFWFHGLSVPTRRAWTKAREEFVCERDIADPNKSTFIRTFAMNPGFITWLLFPVTYRRAERIFEEFGPERLLKAIADGKFDRS